MAVVRTAISRIKSSSEPDLSQPSLVAMSATDGGDTVAPESVFLERVRQEVRRTERSGRPFVLALIGSEASGNGNHSRAMRTLAPTIAASIRETDSLGWYEQNVTMGILFTEIGEANDAKLGLLAQKVTEAMQRSVSDDANDLTLTMRLFPQDSSKKNHDGWEEEIYRDLGSKQGLKVQDGIVKRSIDIASSMAALILLSPLFALIAVSVKLTSRGPVFYCQKRVGQYGRLFDFYKFRSMYVNNDHGVHKEYVSRLIDGAKHVQQSNGMYKLENDPRVTRVGRFLRKSSLDELPQFFNILRGEMSLVGPRPPLPYEYERYRAWHRRRVLEIKPGLTGLWQVRGRSRTTFDQMVRMDLHYARTRSLWMDIKIILQTPAAMFSGTGAS